MDDSLVWLSVLEVLSEKYYFDQKSDDEYFIVTNLYSNNNLRNDLKSWLKRLRQNHYKQKSSELGNELKLRGNECFNKRDYKGALLFYNKCLEVTPRTSKLFTLALSNRASAFIEIKKYREALCDTDLLFILKTYPVENLYKIHAKELKCYSALGDIEKAEAAHNNAFNYLRNHSGYPQKEIDCITKKLENIKINICTESCNNKNEESTPVLRKEMKYLNGASDSLSLRYSEDKGRHVVSKNDLMEDELLFVEAPFAFISIQSEDSFWKVCDRCGSLSDYIITCLECCDSYYCSEECRIASWKDFHQWECEGSKMSLWSSIGIAHLALRVVFEGLKTAYGLKNDPKDALLHMNTYEDITSVYGRVFHLNTNQDKINRSDLIKYAMTSLMMCTYLWEFTDFFKQIKSRIKMQDHRSFIACLLYKHVLQMICNASGIHMNKMRQIHVPDDKDPVIGVGIYPSTSMMNHSCVPNTRNSYLKNLFIVKADRDIHAGCEVFNCYGPRNYDMDRKSILKGQYGFDCKCEACI